MEWKKIYMAYVYACIVTMVMLGVYTMAIAPPEYKVLIDMNAYGEGLLEWCLVLFALPGMTSVWIAWLRKVHKTGEL